MKWLNPFRRNRSKPSGQSTTGATVICLRGSGTVNGWLPPGSATSSTAGSGATLECRCPSCQAWAAGDLVVDRFGVSLRKLAE